MQQRLPCPHPHRVPAADRIWEGSLHLLRFIRGSGAGSQCQLAIFECSATRHAFGEQEQAPCAAFRGAFLLGPRRRRTKDGLR